MDPAPAQTVRAALGRRAARAETLAATSSTAAEMLRFAAGLYHAQARAVEALGRVAKERPLSGRLEEDR